MSASLPLFGSVCFALDPVCARPCHLIMILITIHPLPVYLLDPDILKTSLTCDGETFCPFRAVTMFTPCTSTASPHLSELSLLRANKPSNYRRLLIRAAAIWHPSLSGLLNVSTTFRARATRRPIHFLPIKAFDKGFSSIEASLTFALDRRYLQIGTVILPDGLAFVLDAALR